MVSVHSSKTLTKTQSNGLEKYIGGEPELESYLWILIHFDIAPWQLMHIHYCGTNSAKHNSLFPWEIKSTFRECGCNSVVEHLPSIY